jgi:hypothetical protein
VLEPVDVTAQALDGRLHCSDVRVASELFALAGAGHVGFDGTGIFRFVLRIAPPLSAAMVRSVNELDALLDREGWMEIPVSVTREAQGIAVRPDVQHVAARIGSRLLSEKLADLLGDTVGSDQPTDDATEPVVPQAEPATESPQESSPLESLLRGVLQQYLPSEPSPQTPQ